MRRSEEGFPSMFVRRLIGVFTLKSPVYREIAHDRNSVLHGWIVVVLAALIQFASVHATMAKLGAAPRFAPWMLIAVTDLSISWLTNSVVVAVLMRVFGYRTSFESVMRIQGYLVSIGIFVHVPMFLTSFVGISLGGVIGIAIIVFFAIQRFRFAQALEEMSRGKAMAAAIVCTVAAWFNGAYVAGQVQSFIMVNPSRIQQILYTN